MANMKNGTSHEELQIVILGCVENNGKYEEFYQVLKDTDYGREIKL